MQTKNIIRVALVTLGILLIPLVLQLTIGTGVDGLGFNWTFSDFIVMGALLFITGLLIHFSWTKMGGYRAPVIALIVLFFLWIWAELAVGLFTNWGS